MFNDRPPWALTLPLNSKDLGTSRWQFEIEGYTNPRAPERG